MSELCAFPHVAESFVNGPARAEVAGPPNASLPGRASSTNRRVLRTPFVLLLCTEGLHLAAGL
jgi:hypothetical protein